MKIGDLALQTGVGVETIRFYEQKGLLAPPRRTSGNFRDYEEEHVERLTFIRHCRALDMSHEEIQVLLGCMDRPEAPCDSANEVLDAHIDHVTRRIAELKNLQLRLKSLRAECAGSSLSENCGILHGLTVPESSGREAGHSHVPLAHL